MFQSPVGFGLVLMVHSEMLRNVQGEPFKKRGAFQTPSSGIFQVQFQCSPPSQFLLAELNTFYLKFVLWMPPEHYLVLLRLVFFVNVGGVAMREIYDFMDDP